MNIKLRLKNRYYNSLLESFIWYIKEKKTLVLGYTFIGLLFWLSILLKTFTIGIIPLLIIYLLTGDIFYFLIILPIFIVISTGSTHYELYKMARGE